MLTFAVIGAGRIGAVHGATVAAHQDAELRLVCDPVESAARDLAARCGARATTDVADVYGAPDVDAVIIGSPTPLHVEHIIRSVEAGKAVLCEKPVALDIARVDACLQAIAGSADRVMIGFNRRFDPTLAEVQARVAAGEIGPLEQLTIVSRDPAPPPVGYLASSGGIFRDMTIHDFDTARFLLGEIAEVSAVGQRLDPEIAATGDFDAAVTTLVARSGAVATIINSRHCASGYDQRVEAFGPAGSLETANHTATSVRFSGAQSSTSAGPYLGFFLERYAAAYRLELSHFIESITAGSPPQPTLSDGRAALVLADAATLSATTGERVRLDGAGAMPT